MSYGCQQYDITRLCRYDRRALDSRCDGCQRTTDKDYLSTMGLWVEGVSHNGESSEKYTIGLDIKKTACYNKFYIFKK